LYGIFRVFQTAPGAKAPVAPLATPLDRTEIFEGGGGKYFCQFKINSAILNNFFVWAKFSQEGGRYPTNHPSLATPLRYKFKNMQIIKN